MLSNQYSAALEEVSRFLGHRGRDYVTLAEKAQDKLFSLKERWEFRDAVYRIYSRADKQTGGAPLKSPEKIAEKLVELKRNDPKGKPSQIPDIVGITLVVYYESQRDMVADGLEKPGVLTNFRIVKRIPKNDRGYHAVHFHVESVGEPRLSELLCEIQVKTLLHDGWATKNHDLIYKSPIELSNAIRSHAKIIGEAIQLVEQQSEIIRSLIERQMSVERNRRKAAQERLMAVITDSTDPAYDARAADLAQKIAADIGHLRTCSESDPCLDAHFQEWQRFRETNGPSRPVCRVITILANARETQDLTAIALQTIEDWINQSEEGEKKGTALNFGALAKYLLGSAEEAAIDARKALEYAGKHGLGNKLPLSNVAYFLAEDYFHRRHRMNEEQRAKILEELADVTRELKVHATDLNILDTLGAVAIATGKDANEVREGWRMCREAFDASARTSPQHAAREAYYLLHEQRACQRLVE